MTKILLLVLQCVFLLALPNTGQADDGKPAVLVIESYHKDFYWDAAYRKGIENIIGERVQLRYFEMDTKRLPPDQYQKRADLAVAEVDKVQPDIVMLGDDNALNFVGPEVVKRNIPIVFLGINGNPRNYFGGQIPENVTGVLERPALKRFLVFIQESQPDWKKILILFDGSNTSKLYRDEPFFFQGKNHAEYLGISVELFFSSNLDAIKSKIEAAQSTHDAMILGGLNAVKDETGAHVDASQITEWIYDTSSLPIFGFWKGMVGFNKSIGGFVADGRLMGEQAGRVVEKVLNGTPASRIYIEQSEDGSLVLSQSSLDHWGLKVDKRLIQGAEYTD